MSMKQVKMTAISAAVAMSLAACGGSSDYNSPPDLPPTVSAIQITEAMQWKPVSVLINSTDPEGTEVTFSFSEGGKDVAAKDGVYTFSHGTLTGSDGNYTYTPFNTGSASFGYTASSNGLSDSSTVTISNIVGDPLAYQQWHLRNTGQKAYAMSDTTKQAFTDLFKAFGYTEEQVAKIIAARFDESVLVPGEDMNVLGAYAQGVTGAGAIAIVADSGLEIRHEDLADNVLPFRSLNFIDGATDPTDPTSTSKTGDHGTSVAGLIAAKGWNGKGGKGVAPDTGLIGMNYLENQTDLASALSHGMAGSGISAGEHVTFNRSYGSSLPITRAVNPIDTVVESYPAMYLRNGLGAVSMKSSGNSFNSSTRYSGNLCDDNGATEYGLTCINANFEPAQSNPEYLSIAAVNSDGMHTSYSTAGANIFVSAPAGEYGRAAPAMVTTDQMSCLRGYAGFPEMEYWDNRYANELPDAGARLYPFNSGRHPENPSCHYTSTFNGTSSAAPNATGVVSLILSANPSLTWRDVKHILASTSTKVDPTSEAVTLMIGEKEFVARDAWVENAAGFNFHNMYGFGRVDAGKAVSMALSYSADLGKRTVGSWVANAEELALEIPDNNADGVTYTVEVTDEVTLEAVQFGFDISNSELQFAPGSTQTTAGIDLAIEVTSPSGTRSMLLSSKQAIITPALDQDWYFVPGYIMKDSVMLANAFYGEPAKGTWTFRFVDTNDKNITTTRGRWFNEYVNNTVPSVVKNVRVRVIGH